MYVALSHYFLPFSLIRYNNAKDEIN